MSQERDLKLWLSYAELETTPVSVQAMHETKVAELVNRSFCEHIDGDVRSLAGALVTRWRL